ncbi:MAG: glycosyltransferase family 87 protein [Pseudomonadota bacterium]
MTNNLSLDHPNAKRLWQLASLNAVASLMLLGSFALNGIGSVTAEGCTRQIIDFHVFWSAAGLALEGRPLAALYPSILQDQFNACAPGWLPWLHPPGALAFVTPFGLLPLIPAWVSFNLISVAALSLALFPFTRDAPPLLLALVLAPTLLPALLAGQFVTLWMAGLVGAIWALRLQRWTLAGLLIGALTLKPTLGLLLPGALLALGAWRTIAVAILTACAIHGTATLFYGTDYWTLLIELYGMHSLNGISQLGTVSTMTSLAAFLAWFGLDTDAALKINVWVTMGLALTVLVVWFRHGAPTDAAVALLTASVPLATPYLWHYDSAFLALTALFLARHLNFDFGLGMGAVLTAFWLGAGVSLWAVATTITEAIPFILTVPPLLLLAFIVSLAHSLAIPKEGR